MDMTDTKILEELWLRRTEKTVGTSFSHEQKVEAKLIALDEAWKKFLAQGRNRKLSRTAIYKYDFLRRRMEDFARRQKLNSLSDFNTDALELFQSEFRGSDVTCSKALERLKAFFRAAFLRKWIAENPALALKGPKPKPGATLPFTDDEMKRILDAVEKYPNKAGKTGQDNALRLRAFILVLRYSGMRLGDVATLSTDRLIEQKLQLYTQKTGTPVYCVLRNS